MNKQEAANALNTLYNVYHNNTTVTPAQDRQYDAMYQGVADWVSKADVPEVTKAEVPAKPKLVKKKKKAAK